MRACAAALVILAAATQLDAQQIARIQNRFRQEQFLAVTSELVSAPVPANHRAADWFIEPVAGEPQFVRLRNRTRPNAYIHIEHGHVMAGVIGRSDWHSAMWTMERMPGTGFVRFRNRWRSERYLHTERGNLEAGPIEPGWWSAQWTVTPSPAASQPLPPPAFTDPEPCNRPQGCGDMADGLTWRNVRPGSVPADAYEAGWEPDGGGRRALFICRAWYRVEGEQWLSAVTGKTGRGFTGCNVPWDGREVEVTGAGYQVLINPLPPAYTSYGAPEWLPSAGGDGAGGRELQGLGETGSCRAVHNNGLHPGGYIRRTLGCAITYGGREVVVPRYEVFTRRSLTGGQ